MGWIALFCPAALSMVMLSRKNGGVTEKLVDGLLAYAGYLLLDNWLAMCVIVYVFHVRTNANSFNSFPFFTKYVFIASFFGLVMPSVLRMLKHSCSIRLEERGKKEKCGE